MSIKKRFTKLAGAAMAVGIVMLGLTQTTAAQTAKTWNCGAASNEGGAASVICELSEDGTFTVSGVGDMRDYSWEALWYERREEIVAVVINEGVASIGNTAFRGCTNLTSVTIGPDVTSIGARAFYNCSSLTSITIGPDVTSIGVDAFYNCTNLKSVAIGLNVASIGNSAFDRCSSLTSITIGPDVTSIEDNTFRNCVSLTSVTIGANVASIGRSAFNGCTNLTSITIPSSVMFIENYAFSDCGLTSLTFPNNDMVVELNAFDNCKALTSVTAPVSVKFKDRYVFSRCDNLDTVTITGTGPMQNYQVSSVSPWAHKPSITTIIIEEGVTTIGQYAFDGSEGLISIAMPTTLTTIEAGAFQNTGLTSIVIPDHVTSVKGLAFSNSALKSVTIPVTTTIIGHTAYQQSSFMRNDSLTTLTITGTGPLNDRWPMYNSYNLKTLIIEDGVTSIGEFAFDGVRRITSVTIGKGVESIGMGAFRNTGLQSVTIPSNVKTIGGGAFAESRLTTVTIEDGVDSIGNNTFRDCDLLESIVIPGSVKSIGIAAFQACSSMTSLVIGEAVESIGDRAFAHCKRLTSITIPANVTEIGNYAFENCTGLKTVTALPVVPPTITVSLFSGPFSQKVSILYVPLQSLQAYSESDWRHFFDEIRPVGNSSILASDRVIPNIPFDEDAAVVVPRLDGSGDDEFAVGPNVVGVGGHVRFFVGGRAITDGQWPPLRIYDAAGNLVRTVRAGDGWDLRDGKGRYVSSGTYLVRGRIDGRRVSSLVSVVVVR